MMDFLREISKYFVNEAGVPTFLGKLLYSFGYLAVILLVLKLVYKAVDRWIAKSDESTVIRSVDPNRAKTLSNTFKAVLKWIFMFIWLISFLDILGVSTKSILATAGLGSVAIGFGAQSLVKDVITGFFILLEDQYRVGDYVKIGGFEGNVEELGIRVTKLRSLSGEYHIIPNSSISAVSNYSRGSMRSLVKLSVAYGDDIDRASRVIEHMCEELSEDELFIEGPKLLGVTALADFSIDFTVIGMTEPGNQFAGERMIRRAAKYAFDENGITIPFPTTTVLVGDEDVSEI